MESTLGNIRDTLLARLKRIKLANSYPFDHAGVEFAKRDSDGWKPAARKILIEQTESTDFPAHFCPGNPARRAWAVNFRINLFNAQLDVDDTQTNVVGKNIDEATAHAVIQKAVVAGQAQSWQWFGNDTNGDPNAYNATFAQAETFDDPGFDGVTVNLQVFYRTPEPEPFVV